MTVPGSTIFKSQYVVSVIRYFANENFPPIFVERPGRRHVTDGRGSRDATACVMLHGETGRAPSSRRPRAFRARPPLAAVDVFGLRHGSAAIPTQRFHVGGVLDSVSFSRFLIRHTRNIANFFSS